MEERVSRRIRRTIGGIDIDASIDAVVAVNEGSSRTSASSSSQTVRISQSRSGTDDTAPEAQEKNSE